MSQFKSQQVQDYKFDGKALSFVENVLDDVVDSSPDVASDLGRCLHEDPPSSQGDWSGHFGGYWFAEDHDDRGFELGYVIEYQLIHEQERGIDSPSLQGRFYLDSEDLNLKLVLDRDYSQSEPDNFVDQENEELINKFERRIKDKISDLSKSSRYDHEGIVAELSEERFLEYADT